jgi:4-amino-4-deoxy-L-arabinose transferase-like glycosyltransferase
MLLILLLAVFLFFRLVNLNIIPVFADEAIYIFWSQQAWHDHTQRFISLSDGKPPLHTWLMIPFLKIIKDPLIAGRLLSVMAGLATLVALFLLVRKVFNQKLALTASILLSICPFLVFYNRLAVADSLLTAFAVWSFYLSLLLKEKPDLGKAFLLGFCWGGGLLTKQPALYFILLSPLVFLLERRFNFRKPFYWFLALILAFLSYNIVKLSPYSHLVSSRSYDYVLTKREFLENPFQLFWGNLKGITVWLFSYQTIFGVLLFLLGLVLLTKNNWRKAVVFFSWL